MRPDKGQPSVIQAVIHCLHQYKTTGSYFVSSASLKWKDERKRIGFYKFKRSREGSGEGWGGVAGNWVVKVYKQSEEPAVQEAKW